MSDLSKKTLISSGDTKNYIENYWTKRADAFAALRRQELHSEKYSQWQREIVQHLPPRHVALVHQYIIQRFAKRRR